MERADEKAAGREADVRGEEEQARARRRPGADAERIHGRVEEDGPAGGHDAEGCEAGAEVGAGVEDRDGEDRVVREVGLDEEEDA